MFYGKTTFVVGAGASKEADLPTGEGLKNDISGLLSFERSPDNNLTTRGQGRNGRVYQALQGAAQRFKKPHEVPAALQALLAAADRIRVALPAAPSIDNFIDSHAGDNDVELCGKLAIVQAILTAEKHSKLFVNSNHAYNILDLNKLQKTWYLELTKLLFENCRKEDIAERFSRISFIIFNYDRCIEHFLFWMLRLYYSLQEDEASALLKPVKFFHPYGTVGPLPWQGRMGSVEFGKDDADILSLASQIKTFTEGTDEESSDIVDLRAEIDAANIVVFLGFGFHRLNMRLITPTVLRPMSSIDANKRYYGTAAGLSKSDIEIVEAQLHEMCSVRPQTGDSVQIRGDCYCDQLFKEYHLSLSAYR